MLFYFSLILEDLKYCNKNISNIYVLNNLKSIVHNVLFVFVLDCLYFINYLQSDNSC